MKIDCVYGRNHVANNKSCVAFAFAFALLRESCKVLPQRNLNLNSRTGLHQHREHIPIRYSSATLACLFASVTALAAKIVAFLLSRSDT